jgi:hypothetical protein
MESKTTYPRVITVTFEAEEGKQPLPPESVEIREIPVKRYPKVASSMSPEEAFIDAVLMKPVGWALSLTPESYEQVATGVKEANSRFFGYVRRHQVLADEIGVRAPR